MIGLLIGVPFACGISWIQIGWLRKELRDLKQADLTAASSGRMSEVTAASILSTEMRIPLSWTERSTLTSKRVSDGSNAMSAIRLLERLEKARAIRLPHSANAEHLFSTLLHHGLGMRTCTAVQAAVVDKWCASDSQWQTVKPRLAYLLKISPGTTNSMEGVVKKLASLLIENITTVEWASYDRFGNPISDSRRKKRPVRPSPPSMHACFVRSSLLQ